MLSVAQYSWLLLLVPLVAGLALIALDKRITQRVALGGAIGAAIIAFVAALFVAFSTLGIAPQLVTLVSFGSAGIVERIDNFAAYLIIGITAWIVPVLIWMTAPRGQVVAEQTPSYRPTGFALIAASLALGAVLLDNVLLITLCWSGVGFVAWLMARPEGNLRPTSRDEWFDLPLLTAGPLLFVLAMIFPMAAGKTLSLLDMAGHSNLFNFVTGVLLLLVLAWAAGVYPFMIWVRRVAQGVLPETVGVLLLLLTPLAVAMLGRMLVALAPSGTWPLTHIGPAPFSLNALSLIIGILTVIVAGIVLLFEHELLVIAALLNALVLGWCFAAYGTGDSHTLIGVTLMLLVQTLAIGTLMAVISSLEWSGRNLQVRDLAGLAQDLPGHFIALSLALLALVGMPLLGGFAAMATIDQGIISEGGTAALGGALVWIGNALALLAVARVLSRALNRIRTDEEVFPPKPASWETMALFVPAALMLLIGIAPELLFIGKAPMMGPVVSAAAALLPTTNQFSDVAITPLGFSVGNLLWIPGVFWALAIVAAAVVALSTGLINAETTPSPVFAGGEPLPPAALETGGQWFTDLLPIARSPWLLPGPRAWRYDLADEMSPGGATAEAGEAEVDEVDEEVFILEESGEAEELDEDEAGFGDEEAPEEEADFAAEEEAAGEGETDFAAEEKAAAEEEPAMAEADMTMEEEAEGEEAEVAPFVPEDEIVLHEETVAEEPPALEEPVAAPGEPAVTAAPEEEATASATPTDMQSEADEGAEAEGEAATGPTTPPPPAPRPRPPTQTARPRPTGKGGKKRGKR
jgi:formate hydrogenlyase subunit 3/multisubunit Na+/H+ antiporter MnhD subunit